MLGKDGVYRDLAGLRGTYRLIDKTDAALNLIGKTLQELNVQMVKFIWTLGIKFRQTKSKIFELSEQWGCQLKSSWFPMWM